MPRAFDAAKLTAYVLGELSEREREMVQRHLESSAEARREVEAIRQVTGLLSRALSQEAPDHLTARQRAAIETGGSNAHGTWRHPVWWGSAAAAAAVIAIAAFWSWRAGLVPDTLSAVQGEARTPAGAGEPEMPGPRAVAPPIPEEEPRVADAAGRRPAPANTAAPTRPEAREARIPQGDRKPDVALEVAQGEVRGRTVDALGAAIPGATVRIVEEATGEARETFTGHLGEFSFTALAPGRYRMTIALTGFETWERRNVLVSGTRVADLGAVPLAVASLAEVTSLVGASPMIDLSDTAAGDPFHSGVSAEARERVEGREAVAVTDPTARRTPTPFSTEAYEAVRHNPFVAVAQDPLSTFSIDVDTASYANVRRFLTGGQLPPPGAVRIEELVNTFTYDYPPPDDEHPFAVHLDVAQCPWAPDHQLVRIGLKGREIEEAQRPPSNLVFLIDVSGSMESPNKLPLVKRSLRLLVERLDERDRVALVVYAGTSGLVLPPVPASDRTAVLDALDRLEAGGSTHGSAGLRLAYETARRGFISGGVNRVVLATDGDFNVGVTSEDELTRLIEDEARSGVYLTVLGFGMGNYKDSTLEQLADRGDGNYAYIDTIREAKRALVDGLAGTLVTIARDVKIQVEFNPTRVAEYRLVGYENRLLADQDFDDDTKDAGEIGAGHTVTALYEIVPVGAPPVSRAARPLKYQEPRTLSGEASGEDILTVQLRYKPPDGDRSVLLEEVLKGPAERFERAPDDFRFASAVAAFGMILRESPYKGAATLADVGRWARHARGGDPHRQREEFIELVAQARGLIDRGQDR